MTHYTIEIVTTPRRGTRETIKVMLHSRRRSSLFSVMGGRRGWGGGGGGGRGGGGGGGAGGQKRVRPPLNRNMFKYHFTTVMNPNVFPKSDRQQTYTRYRYRHNADVVTISASWLTEFSRNSQKFRIDISLLVLWNTNSDYFFCHYVCIQASLDTRGQNQMISAIELFQLKLAQLQHGSRPAAKRSLLLSSKSIGIISA